MTAYKIIDQLLRIMLQNGYIHISDRVRMLYLMVPELSNLMDRRIAVHTVSAAFHNCCI